MTSSNETPLCPKCQAPMQLKKKSGTNYQFWGCPNFFSTSKCNGYLPYRPVKATRPVSGTVNKNIVGSPEQIAIWESMLHGVKHLIVQAVAGSGKTFTIVHGAMLILSEMVKTLSIAFFAFNKHIVTELEGKLPESILVKTMHSFGFNMIKAWNPRVELDEYKLDGIIDEHLEQDDSADYLRGIIARLVNLCKYNMIDGKNDDDLDDLVLMHGLDLNDHRGQIYTIVPQVIQKSKGRKNVIDYTDMLWFLFVHNIPIKTFDVVIVDELQDLNPLQQWIALKTLGTNGRFIGVGDPWQSIYGFAGAMMDGITHLIDKLSQTSRDVESLPLTVSRRCAVSIIDLAQQIVPHIRAMDDASIGSVEEMSENAAIEAIKPGMMGICRRTAPLIKVAYALMRNGMPVYVKGRDFGKGMLALIKKIKARDIEELLEKAELYRSKELAKLDKIGKKADNAKQVLNDKIDTLIALTDGLNDLSELRSKITTLFSDTDNKKAVLLSTVHKSKGLEADVVFIFDYARIEIKMSLPHQQQQERNVHYVALTRAKERLILVD